MIPEDRKKVVPVVIEGTPEQSVSVFGRWLNCWSWSILPGICACFKEKGLRSGIACLLYGLPEPELTEEEVDSLASTYDFSGGQIENICRKRSIDHILWGKKALNFDALKAHCDSELLNRKDEVRRIGFRV